MAPQLFWGWVILLGAFVVDATVTLVRRVRRGERFYQAHRSHAYQYAARQYGAHPPVSLAFGAITLCWLLPVAALVAVGWLDGVLGVVMAYAPLIWLAVRFKAGALTEDIRGTRYRIEGPAQDGRLIHVICRFKEDANLIVITVYALSEDL